MDKKLNFNNKGFTLIEVMIAVTLFGTFITAFVVSQGGNINNSIQMQSSLTLLRLCESKMNEVILNPPKFTNLTDKEVISKNFEIEGYKEYKYTIEYKKVEFPEFESLLGQTEDETRQQGNDALVKKTLFKKLKENIEKILWQAKVTVENTTNGEKYDLSTWIENSNAQIDSNFGI